MEKSFARVDKNSRAIADRGWGSYNRNILTFSQIGATITENDYLKDLSYHVVSSPSSPVSEISNDLFSDNLFSTISGRVDSRSINWNGKLVASVIDTRFLKEDKLVARERINIKHKTGKTFRDGISDATKLYRVVFLKRWG